MTDVLIGRDPLMASVASALTGTSERHTAIMFVGERGAGKTTCVGAAAELGRRRGRLVVSTAGHESERALPFAGLHRLLRPLFPAIVELEHAQRSALEGALGLREVRHVDPIIAALATERLLCSDADAPLTLVTVDDMHLLDSSSLGVVRFLANRVRRSGLVIVATSSMHRTRPRHAPSFRRLVLDPLSDEDSHALLDARAPGLEASHRTWIVGHADGNPSALIGLTSQEPPERTLDHPLEAAVPLSVQLQRMYADGLDALPDATRDAVLVASLSFSDDLAEVVAATALMTGRQIDADVLDAAADIGMLSYDDTRIRFRHRLTKSAITQGATVGRRQAAHRALGDVITERSSRRTWHRAIGAPGPEISIAASLEVLGSECVRRGDVPAAVLALRRAAELSPSGLERGRRLMRCALYAADLGNLTQALAMSSAAALDELSDPDRLRREVLEDRCGNVPPGDADWIVRNCRSAERVLERGEPRLATDVAFAAAAHGLRSALPPEAAHGLERLAARVATEADDVRAVAILAIVAPENHGGDLGTWLCELDAGGIPTWDVLRDLGSAAWAAGHLERCVELLDRAASLLRRRHLRAALAPVLSMTADAHLEMGRWDRAAAALSEALALGDDVTTAYQRAELLVTGAKLAALRGDVERVRPALEDARRLVRFDGGGRLLAQAEIAQAIASISSGRHLDACVRLERLFDPADPGHHARSLVGAIGYFADAAARTMRRDHVDGALARMESAASHSRSPLLGIELAHARAVLADDELAEPLILDGLAADLTAWPWPRARLQLVYGRWLRRHRHVSRSRSPLTSAFDTLEELGATRWAHDAADEIRATARRSVTEREADPALASLSSQEHTIALLAARGFTNADIGRELSLSPRTIGSHLYRVFPKLDITSRAQLSSRLRDDGS